jgi:anti-sigma factor RsiW
MRCSDPPPLTEDQITAALDGEAEPAIYDHLAQCEGCAARLAQAQQIERALKAGLQRWDCPTPQQLGDYHLGLVGQADAHAITRHLEHCARCSDEIEELRMFLIADASPRRPAARPPARPRPLWPTELIARLLPRTPALAVRGATGPIKAEANGVTIFLDVQPAAEGRVMLTGQVVADGMERWVGALVELRQAGKLCATAALDDLGSFSAGPLTAEPTELRVTPPSGPSLVVRDIELAA